MARSTPDFESWTDEELARVCDKKPDLSGRSLGAADITLARREMQKRGLEVRGPGRPSKPGGGHIQFRLDGDLYPKLEELAEASGKKPADFVRDLVIASLQ